MRESNLPFKEHHPIVNLVDATSPRTLCHGALISPRFVLTTTRCAEKTKRVFIHYGAHNSSDWFANARDHIEPMDNKIALIELDRDVKDSTNVLVCLYSSISRQDAVNYTTRIAHTDSFVRLEGIRVQYQINTPLRVLYYCSRYLHHGHFTSPGDVLVIKNEDERFYRVMGVLENELDCKPFDYFYEREKAVQAINVEIYLPWIEDVVWGEITN
ncbi:uncharacterized protein LOC135704592 [Ochlerotatus camptorhynchus]|uniref:uncharacterized protein LOC135704592 n=1 Tax=Ochlerotatus camptorhynchus TaxID=644619 RepID=UPI0031D2E4D2